MTMVAALFVETNGVYFGLPNVDPWDEARDARTYAGPHPVVAHPPCQRWGRFWHGAPNKPHQYRKGADRGCFAAALTAVRNFGGVLEHPKDSLAWDWFGLRKPRAEGGWIAADQFCGWTCCVDQGFYGHFSNKPTWLYAVGWRPEDLKWGRGEQRIPEWMIARYGYEKARRIGVVAMVGGKDKTKIRNATPIEFRDVLIGMAQAPCKEEDRNMDEKDRIRQEVEDKWARENEPFFHAKPKADACKHDWTGPERPIQNGSERTCAKCGMGALAWTLSTGF